MVKLRVLQLGPEEGDSVQILNGLNADETVATSNLCLLYTSDAADERSSVDLGGRRIIKKKNKIELRDNTVIKTKKQETSRAEMTQSKDIQERREHI